MITRHDKEGLAGVFDINPEFTFVGMTVTIKAFTFIKSSVQYELAEDQVVVITQAPTGEGKYYNFWLVKNKTTDEVDVLVDEVRVTDDPDTAGARYQFEQESPYVPIYPILEVFINQGVTSLDDCRIQTWSMIPPPPPPEEPTPP